MVPVRLADCVELLVAVAVTVVEGDDVVLCASAVGLCDCEQLGVILAVLNCEEDGVAVGDIVSDNDDVTLEESVND